MHIKHTGGDGIRKMDDEVMSFDPCDAVTMLCGLTWTWRYIEHDVWRIQPEIASGNMIHPVYIEPGDMIQSIYIEPGDMIEPAGIL